MESTGAWRAQVHALPELALCHAAGEILTIVSFPTHIEWHLIGCNAPLSQAWQVCKHDGREAAQHIQYASSVLVLPPGSKCARRCMTATTADQQERIPVGQSCTAWHGPQTGTVPTALPRRSSTESMGVDSWLIVRAAARLAQSGWDDGGCAASQTSRLNLQGCPTSTAEPHAAPDGSETAHAFTPNAMNHGIPPAAAAEGGAHMC